MNMQSKLDGKKSVFPLITLDEKNIIELGLNKRELFSAMAMQGLLRDDFAAFIANSVTFTERIKDIAKASVEMADALLKELNKDK